MREPGLIKVRCRSGLCNGVISVGTISQETGLLSWQTLTSIYNLEERVSSIIHQAPSVKNYGFCFIRCAQTEDIPGQREAGNTSSKMQLLIFPPQIEPLNQRVPSFTSEEEHSINVIHIDALSRDHFIRSLPKTISMLNKIKSTEGGDVEVLDFRLLQTVKARTYESLKLLFTGELPPDIDLVANPFDADEIPANTSIAFDFLFGAMKQKGRQTLYIDDLCWRFNWGLAKHLGIWAKNLSTSERWKRFQEAIISNHIDDIGPSPASCHILESYHMEDPFQGPERICFNGYHHHQYLLKYLLSFQETIKNMHRQFFSFYMSNIAHEPSGRRVQALDLNMAQYLTSLAEMPNILTIITSDHGNSYGEYTQSTFQGRLETFNPVLFLIIPKKLANTYGKDWLHNLKLNQWSLITQLDIHLFLKSLTRGGKTNLQSKVLTKRQHKHKHKKSNFQKRIKTESVSKDLMFNGTLNSTRNQNPIANTLLNKRTCNDIHLLVDTICVCEGYFTHAAPQPRYALLATFAVGEINNIIGRQRVKFQADRPKLTTGCLPLAVRNVTDCWIRHENVRK